MSRNWKKPTHHILAWNLDSLQIVVDALFVCIVCSRCLSFGRLLSWRLIFFRGGHFRLNLPFLWSIVAGSEIIHRWQVNEQLLGESHMSPFDLTCQKLDRRHSPWLIVALQACIVSSAHTETIQKDKVVFSVSTFDSEVSSVVKTTMLVGSSRWFQRVCSGRLFPRERWCRCHRHGCRPEQSIFYMCFLEKRVPHLGEFRGFWDHRRI